ncbi:MAG: hypothetical protein M3Z66_17870 [Chloroflexota bacterium]|nr:hypothetical protein [Chloroflexota bacterium]
MVCPKRGHLGHASMGRRAGRREAPLATLTLCLLVVSGALPHRAFAGGRPSAPTTEQRAAIRSYQNCLRLRPDMLLVQRFRVPFEPPGHEILRNTRPYLKFSQRQRAVERLFTTVCRLIHPRPLPPNTPPVTISCSGAAAAQYELSFERLGRLILVVNARISFCLPLGVGPAGSNSPLGYITWHSPFWCQLSRALAVPEVSFFPYVVGFGPQLPGAVEPCHG